MDARMVEATTRLLLLEIRQRLNEAASIAKAAEACTEAGNAEKGVQIALDIEQITYEANALFNAASLINLLKI